MNDRLRRITVVSLGAVGILLAAAAVARACVPMGVVTVQPNSGPVGTRALVSGRGFQPGPLKIQWNPDGPVLNTTVADERGTFNNVPMTVPPDRVCRVHYVIVSGTDASPHGTHNSGDAVFHITDPANPSCQPATSWVASRRARAIRRCKQKYRGSSRTAKRKRAACIRTAKRRYRV